MSTLHITRGLPGSGKTYWAKQWLREEGPRERGRVNRDDLRMSLFGKPAPLTFEQEKAVTAVQRSAIESMLRKGWDVVVDDTNLRAKYLAELLGLAVQCGADYEIHDEFLDVSLEMCLARDDHRRAGAGRVGAQVIRDMHRKFLAQYKGRKVPIPEPKLSGVSATLPGVSGGSLPPGLVPYVPDEDAALPMARLCDLDGTLYKMMGRGPYDYHRVDEDEIAEAVRIVVEALQAQDFLFILLSGRDEVCRALTEKTLARDGVEYEALFMRPEGNQEKDSVIKLRLFDEHIRDKYHVVGVFDDRNQVVEMWRALGLQCFQVAPGDF